MYGRGKKLSKTKTQDIRNYFISKNKTKKSKIEWLETFAHFLKQKKKKKRKKEIGGKKETNERLIKDRITRDIRTLFEQEEQDYYKFKRVSNILNNKYIE